MISFENISVEEKNPENDAEKENSTKNANSTALAVENENLALKIILNSTDDAQGEEKVVEEGETTTVPEVTSTSTSTTRSPFRNRGRLSRSRL